MKKIMLLLVCVSLFSCSTEEESTSVTSSIETANSSLKTNGDCYFAFNPTLDTNSFGQFVVTLSWDFSSTVYDEELLTQISSQVEVREYPFSNFCINQNPSGQATTYTFNIPDVINNPTGTLSLTFGQDFQQKCFEWRIVSNGAIANGSNLTPCQSVSNWVFFSLT